MSIIEVTGNPRHDQLVHYISERGYMNIEELAQLLDVSTQTVRRDIRKLSEQGLITRHHGGAGRVSRLRTARVVPHSGKRSDSGGCC